MSSLDSDNFRGVIVLGVFRSGSSLMAKVVHHLGVDFGPAEGLSAGDKHNPGGYLERRDVNHLNGRLFETAGRTFADPGDPETLAQHADASVWNEVDLSWLNTTPWWGLKDPRLCAALWTWITHDWIDPATVRIVHLERDFEAVVRSAERYPGVNHHFNHDLDAIRTGVQRYVDLARWHVAKLDRPTLHVTYENLLADPRKVVEELAAFLDVTDPRKVRTAANEVGKKKARFKLFTQKVRRRVHRIFHSPRK